MDTHIQGPVDAQEQGAVVSQRGFILTTGEVILCTIRASSTAPVVLEFLGLGAGTIKSRNNSDSQATQTAVWSTPVLLVADTIIKGTSTTAGDRLIVKATGCGLGPNV